MSNLKFIKYIILSLIFTFVVSCSENITIPVEKSPSVSLSKLSEIQKQVFNTSCANSGCHSGSSPKANLNLTEGNSYSNLVGKQALMSPSFMRVKAGDATNSYLIRMLKNSGPNTSLMPPNGKLSDAIIDSISVWINKGAKND
ncbi:MAG: hypothetical protein N2321_11220 [Melioribacteraceae bacterium]|nr:hypothetical protein [Melioribacteraceae bacterium]